MSTTRGQVNVTKMVTRKRSCILLHEKCIVLRIKFLKVSETFIITVANGRKVLKTEVGKYSEMALLYETLSVAQYLETPSFTH